MQTFHEPMVSNGKLSISLFTIRFFMQIEGWQMFFYYFLLLFSFIIKEDFFITI